MPMWGEHWRTAFSRIPDQSWRGIGRRHIVRTWYKHYWDRIRTSFWFVPGFLVLLATGMSFALSEVDALVDRSDVRWLITSGPADAKVILTSIAGAAFGISGVVFSVTIATLSIAAAQYGSRPLRTFLNDVTTQVALGTFLATSIFCLLVLRDIRDVQHEAFVPQISLNFAMAMALVSMAILVFFIHHIAVSIQASKVVQSIARDLDSAIVEQFPAEIGFDTARQSGNVPSLEKQLALLGENYAVVPAPSDGYVEIVDGEVLLETAMYHNLVVQLTFRPGFFLVKDLPAARIWPAERVSELVVSRFHECLLLGARRTPRQDLECAIDEMSEVAVRALSPGINDPYTAMASIDRLGAALSRLAVTAPPSPYRLDEEGWLRVIVAPTTFAEALLSAFSEIREYGRSSLSVNLRLLETLELLATCVHSAADRAAILEEAEMINSGCQSVLVPQVRDYVVRQFRRVVNAVNLSPESQFPLPTEINATSQHTRGSVSPDL